MKLITSGDLQHLATVPSTAIPVLLYQPRGTIPNGGTVGNGLVKAIQALPARPSTTAFDFLTIALSVIAADTFVRRNDAPDNWTRTIELEIAVADPTPWQSVNTTLEKALSFLSGDIWRFRIVGGGPSCPPVSNKLASEDCVCLFSGGLDSTLGAIKLTSEGRLPLLVSQAYPREGTIQRSLAKIFGQPLHHFVGNADPKFSGNNETSMRPRSLLFLACGILAASSLANSHTPQTKVDVFVPENGLIALNPPLTRRRLGSHSTRTTHPWFLTEIRKVLQKLNLPINLINPFEFETKGEMMASSPNPNLLKAHATETVSCGKWKRKRKQCGRCLPCLIRRAAFHHSGITDNTLYRFPTLSDVKNNPKEHDDLLALALALRKSTSANLDSWVTMGRPLPEDPQIRKRYVNVFQRGMDEMKDYLTAEHCYP